MKPSIPAHKGPGGGLVVASDEKASLLAFSLTVSSIGEVRDTFVLFPSV